MLDGEEFIKVGGGSGILRMQDTGYVKEKKICSSFLVLAKSNKLKEQLDNVM